MTRVALRDVDLHFVRWAWRLVTWTVTCSPVTHTHSSFTHTQHCHTQLFHTHVYIVLTCFDTTLWHTQFFHLLLTTLSHHPSGPCPFSLLPFPSHLHVLLGDYWKKLTCGVIRSFNLYESNFKHSEPFCTPPNQVACGSPQERFTKFGRQS